jgi:hypothetical protein
MYAVFFYAAISVARPPAALKKVRAIGVNPDHQQALNPQPWTPGSDNTSALLTDDI